MAEELDKIENWMKKYPKRELGFMTLLLVTNVNDIYAEKVVTFKHFPNLFHIAAEKVEGRSKISFGHVKKDRAEINLTYFGDLLIGRMIHITDIEGVVQLQVGNKVTKHTKVAQFSILYIDIY